MTGCLVAIVVKKFDNIVKLYSQAMSNMFMAIACSLLFPDKFRLNALFLCCLVGVFTAICLYESKENLQMDRAALIAKLRAHRCTGLLIIACAVASYFASNYINLYNDKQ